MEMKKCHKVLMGVVPKIPIAHVEWQCIFSVREKGWPSSTKKHY